MEAEEVIRRSFSTDRPEAAGDANISNTPVPLGGARGSLDHGDKPISRDSYLTRGGASIGISTSLENPGSDADVSSLSSLDGTETEASCSGGGTTSAPPGGGGVIENLKRLSGYRRLQSSAGSSGTLELDEVRQLSLGDEGLPVFAGAGPEQEVGGDGVVPAGSGRRQSLPPQTLEVQAAGQPAAADGATTTAGGGPIGQQAGCVGAGSGGTDFVHYRNGTATGVNQYTTPGSPEAVLQLNGGSTPAAMHQHRQFPVEDVHEFNCGSSASVTCELKVAVVQPVASLQAELKKAHEDLKLRDEEVGRLKCLRDEVGAELEDLTASLFQEAHKMVREAKVKGDSAEKALKEANMKIEVLQAEVQALKTLVITSTPSMPNRHLHPQLDSKNNGHKENGEKNGVPFLRGHKRSPSHNNLKYGRETTPPGSPVKEPPPQPLARLEYEVDPVYHNEFVSWKEAPCVNKEHPFLARIYREDIIPCLSFANTELTKDIEKALEENAVVIETVSGKNPFPKRCAMLDTPRLCKYRMKLGDSDQWHYISQLCRNRIAAACDFLCYLRYIEQGLVKSSIHEVYGEILRLRKQMAVAKLGLN